MDKLQKYIDNLATSFPRYSLSDEDKKMIEMKGKTEWITKMLLRKKFRKTKIFEETRKDILKKVALSIKEERPLYFIILFGGYKHFWNSSYPEVDWAEFFNLNFMSEFLAPVLEVHRPGVILDYGSEDVVMTLMDNYPETDLDKYAESFEEMIKFYSKHIPNNFKINYVHTGKKYDSEKLKAKIKEKLPEKKKEWEKLSNEEKKKSLHRSYRSVMWDGKEDWTRLSDIEKEGKIKESKIIEDTFYEIEAEFLGDYFIGDNHIPLVLSWGLTDENIDHWLTLGSTYASTVDFWIGRGIIEDRGERFIPRIVSKEQYNSTKTKLNKVKIDSLSLKNLQYLEVYNGELDFKKQPRTE